MNERINKCNVNNFIYFLQHIAFDITKDFLKVASTFYNFRFSVGFQTLVQCQYTFMQSSCPQKS